jgi:AraC family transcriptional regulator of arabinose operon
MEIGQRTGKDLIVALTVCRPLFRPLYLKGAQPLSDHIGPKYYLAGSDFSIQHMRYTGFHKMSRPHSHPSYELHYLLRGERVYFMNGGVYTAHKGDMAIVRPGDLHSASSSDAPECDRMLIHFMPSLLNGAESWLYGIFPFGESRLVRFPLREQAGIERLLLQMLEECRESADFCETGVRAMLIELLVRIRRAMKQEQEPDISRHPMQHKVSDVAAFVHLNYKDPISLGQVAERFDISPSYLSRIFVKLTGFHFGEYVQVMRIREAEKRLRSTREKVQVIAEQVGFEHLSHFNRVFRKHTGLSPLQYRKLNGPSHKSASE